jgi:hypothetical protein
MEMKNYFKVIPGEKDVPFKVMVKGKEIPANQIKKGDIFSCMPIEDSTKSDYFIGLWCQDADIKWIAKEDATVTPDGYLTIWAYPVTENTEVIE